MLTQCALCNESVDMRFGGYTCPHCGTGVVLVEPSRPRTPCDFTSYGLSGWSLCAFSCVVALVAPDGWCSIIAPYLLMSGFICLFLGALRR